MANLVNERSASSSYSGLDVFGGHSYEKELSLCQDMGADVQKLKDGRYIVDPLMTLSDLSDELGIELEPPENSHVETLSGLIQATLGIIPSPGAEVKIQGYTFRVLKMDGTRMEKVMLILPPGKAGPKTQALKKI